MNLEIVSPLSHFGSLSHQEFYNSLTTKDGMHEIESNVQVHTFSSQRDADFFLEGVEATGRLEMDIAATQPVLLSDGRFGIVISWRDGRSGGLSQFNH